MPEQEVRLSDLQVSGIAVIKDKDGNIKGEMKIVSIEEAEFIEAENAENAENEKE